MTRGWWCHLQDEPIPRNQIAFFCRRWLSLEKGELPSPEQGASWLNIKRTYMEVRPHLRRIYMTVCDLPVYADVAVQLGFVPIPQANVKLDGRLYHAAVNDFGPASVDGWLAGLVAAELGVEDAGILDIGSRELVLEGQRVPLTWLEFELMHYLYENEGKAVSRADLLEKVWGYDYEGGSNVVDVVVRTLRTKLGERASLVETVRGVGYRYRGS